MKPYKDMPKAPPFRRLLGPSFILLGLGLGSGETILWPYLTSNYGLGIVWGMVVGITMQFFINMEIERYALINGESIFVGFAKIFKHLPAYFIFSTFIGFGWPGIGLAGATFISKVLNVSNANAVAVAIFILIGVVLSVGKVLYQTVENIVKVVILTGVPSIIFLTVYLASKSDFILLSKGLIGAGDGYKFLPKGISLTTFLAALAYSGAGGNLNLAQSFYVREKGYGMGKYAKRIKGMFRGDKKEDIDLTGVTFDINSKNLKRFSNWWRVVNIEHFTVFLMLGIITMLSLALLSYITTFGAAGNEEGLTFVLNEAISIGTKTIPALGTFFLLVVGLTLTSTQLTVLDSTSRIITENIALSKKNIRLSKTYFLVLWAQILFGIAVLSAGFDRPRTLITLGAIINIIAMFFYTGLLLYLNNKMLAKPLRPSRLRNIVLAATFLFLGGFSVITIISAI